MTKPKQNKQKPKRQKRYPEAKLESSSLISWWRLFPGRTPGLPAAMLPRPQWCQTNPLHLYLFIYFYVHLVFWATGSLSYRVSGQCCKEWSKKGQNYPQTLGCRRLDGTHCFHLLLIYVNFTHMLILVRGSWGNFPTGSRNYFVTMSSPLPILGSTYWATTAKT